MISHSILHPNGQPQWYARTGILLPFTPYPLPEEVVA